MNGFRLRPYMRTPEQWRIFNIRIWLLAIIVPSTTLLLAFILHHLGGNARVWLPFVSETDHSGPEAFVFKIGLYATGILDILMAWRIWELLSIEEKRFHSILVTGVLSGMGAFIVAYFRWFENQEAHLVGALMIFIFGTLWGISVHMTGKHISLDKRGSRIRRISIPLTLVALVCMAIAFSIGITNYPELRDNLDLNQVRTEMLISAAFEWLLFIGFMLTMYSFRWDVTLVSVKTKSE
jgi:hypothetical protein